MQCLTGRGDHIEDIVLWRIWRDVQPVEVKVRHLHARMTDAVFSRLSVQFILVFDIQNTSRLNPNYRRRVVAAISKFRFARDGIGCRKQRHRRACLWQFWKYSALASNRGDKQSDACHPAKCGDREFKKLHFAKLPADERYRDGASVGFYDPTPEVLHAPSFEGCGRYYAA